MVLTWKERINMNGFERLREQCKQYAKDSAQYSWFVKNKLLNEKELEDLLSWYEHPYRRGNVDNDGQIRVMIARQLPATAVLRCIDLNSLEFRPKFLQNYLRQRFADILHG
jgi:hypothetical protein